MNRKLAREIAHCVLLRRGALGNFPARARPRFATAAGAKMSASSSIATQRGDVRAPSSQRSEVDATSSELATVDPVRLITEAISVGVPLFNDGDADGCASVYADVVVKLCQRVPSLSPLLHVALDRAISTRSPSERAWLLRHALDAVLRGELQRGGSSTATRAPTVDPVPTPNAAGVVVVTPAGDVSRPAMNIGDRALEWAAIDDRVMGGSSRSTLRRYDDGQSSFEGTLVVANGGFASVRALLPASVPRVWASSTGLVLTCASDGRPGYKVCLKGDGAVDGVMYQASLPAAISATEDLSTVRLPWSAFKPTFRGRPVRDAPPIRGEQVRQLGFMLSRFDSASGAPMADAPAAGRFQLRLGRVGSF
jgi:NADH dehydrogenase [ubiquinone] 1 alpha subcomplex assembly factor 1